MQCGLKVPSRIEDRVVGAFSLLSRSPHAYSASDLLHAQQLANCLGHGLAYQRLAEQAREAASDRQRSAEIESSVELLRTISGVLDIRTVFPRISEIAKQDAAARRIGDGLRRSGPSFRAPGPRAR